jgi:hypothetical protein
MGIALIVIGFFLLFAFAFNGSVGTEFVNKSFVSSAILLMITGVVVLLKANWNIVRVFSVISLLTYSPMIWQRFNFSFGVDWGGLVFDIGLVIFVIYLIIKKPNKSLKAGTPQSGAP